MYEIKKRKLKKHSCKMKDIYIQFTKRGKIYYILYIYNYIYNTKRKQ